MESLPAIRERYGDAIAGAIEQARDLALEDGPSAQDMRHTLRRLAEQPTAADWTRIDAGTDALLTLHAWRLYRVQGVDALLPEQVAECARAALDAMPKRNGRPATSEQAATLVRNLLHLLPPGTKPRARDALLAEALTVCGFGASLRSIASRKATAADAQRGAPRPAPAWETMLQALARQDAAKARKSRGRRAR